MGNLMRVNLNGRRFRAKRPGYRVRAMVRPPSGTWYTGYARVGSRYERIDLTRWVQAFPVMVLQTCTMAQQCGAAFSPCRRIFITYTVEP